MGSKSIFKLVGELRLKETKLRENRSTYMDGPTSVVVGDLRANNLLRAQDRKRFQNMVANVRV